MFALIRHLFLLFFFFLMIRRPPRSTHCISSAASDVYKRQTHVSIRTSDISSILYKTPSPVSYTHLTLPTICSVQISVVAVSLKKKKKAEKDVEQEQTQYKIKECGEYTT
eukprot:TRINITY_DN7439_c0_g1_i8.p1 TRINITY_DN7439_c0_g1~~TRINITY_DN7439_c0_g1_i8.p1  ORF type:complete len:110 (+),score=38.12 TRINITY_DN7439_c0_g1_i8:104-433(+)